MRLIAIQNGPSGSPLFRKRALHSPLRFPKKDQLGAASASE